MALIFPSGGPGAHGAAPGERSYFSSAWDTGPNGFQFIRTLAMSLASICLSWVTS
jgi:hypothetical protein